jgi:hypothetical protein
LPCFSHKIKSLLIIVLAKAPAWNREKIIMENLKQAPLGVPVQFVISAFQTGKPSGVFVL